MKNTKLKSKIISFLIIALMLSSVFSGAVIVLASVNTTINDTSADDEAQIDADTKSPIISHVSTVNITTNSTTITWRTNEPSDSLVKYGIETGNYTLFANDPSFVTDHSIKITGLLPSTIYYYAVNSTDSSGNQNESVEYNFNTLPESEGIVDVSQPTLTFVAPTKTAPLINDWFNNITNDNSTSITSNKSQSIFFNATADRDIDTWHWYEDGIDQLNNCSSYTTSFNASGSYSVAVNATNAKGVSNTVVFNISVTDVPLSKIPTISGAPLSGAPLSGDWVISGTESYSDQVILLNGNLSILGGASLTLNNVTLIMNGTANGQRTIIIQQWGSLYADISNITGKYYYYYFNNYGYLNMQNSSVSTAYSLEFYDSSDDSSVINNSTIKNNANSGISVYYASPTIIDNTISESGSYGIYADHSSPNIINNTISGSSNYGIYVYHTSSPRIEKNTIKNNNKGGIYIYRHSSPTIINNLIDKNGQYGVYVYYSSPYQKIIGCTISDQKYGIRSESQTVTVENSSISSTSYDYYLYNSAYIKSTNTSFSKSKVYFSGTGGALDVYWHDTVTVEYDYQPVNDSFVEAFDNANSLVTSGVTDDNGQVKLAIKEYTQGPAAMLNCTPHILKATKTGYPNGSIESNVTWTKTDTIVLGEEVYIPEQPLVIFGDWIINDSVSYSNKTIIVDNGNIIIEDGGSLTLNNSLLQLRYTTNAGYKIEIQNGANLFLYDSSVTASYPELNFYYYFRNYGYLNMQNSSVSTTYSIHFYDSSDDSSVINNSTIKNNANSGISVYYASPTIIDNTISESGSYGIYADHSSPNIINNTISGSSNYGIYVYHTSSPRIEKNTIKNNNKGGIYIYRHSSPTIINNLIDKNGQYGVYVYYSSPYQKIIGCTISDQKYGIRSDSSTVTVEDSSISSTSYDYYLYNSAYIKSTNTSFSKSKVLFSGTGGALDVYWHDTVTVEYDYLPVNESFVEVFDNANSLVTSGVTDDNGQVKLAIKEYTQSPAAMLNYTPHILKATKTGYPNGSIESNVTWTKSDTIVLGEEVYIPEQPIVIFGDWIINDSVSYSNKTIIVDNGNIIIEDGGTLTLNNSLLQLRYTTNAGYKVEIQNGGSLFLYDSSVTASYPELNFYYYFRNYGYLNMQNSSVSTAYSLEFYDSSDDSSVINNSTIKNNANSGISVYYASPTIIDNTISESGSYGIYADHSSPNIINNTISGSSNYGIYVYWYSSPRIEKNTIKNNNKGGIYIYRHSSPTIINNLIDKNGQYGVYVYYSSPYQKIIGCTISDQKYGIRSDSSTVTVENTSISSTSYDYYLYNSAYIKSTNTSFSKSKVLFSGTGGALDVYWHLDVNVVDANANPVSKANVSVRDYFDTVIYNGTTDLEGWTREIVSEEYKQTAAGETYYTPHKVSAEYNDTANTTIVTIAESKEATVMLSINQPLTALILSPDNNSLFIQGDTVYCKGVGFDPIDGILANSSLIWTSSIDGEIGIGSSLSLTNLSVGNHTVTFTATNSLNENVNDTVEITVIGRADLIVEDVEWSHMSPNLDDIVTFNATVSNIGLGYVIQPFYVRFYINYTYLGQTIVSNLSANESIIVTQTWTAAPDAEIITVVADYYDDIQEINESNNRRTELLPQVRLPDIVVSAITWTPTTFNESQMVNFSALVENTGAGNTTRYFEVKFYIDNTSIGSEGVNGIMSGNITSVSRTWTATPGDHTIKVVADDLNQVPEYNETNNDRIESLAMIEYADLTVSSITWTPATFCDGDTVNFTAIVENIGAGNITKYFDVNFYIENSSIGSVGVNGLMTGKNVSVWKTWTAVPSNHTIKVAADDPNRVIESNETNNERIETLPSIEQPDLIVTNITLNPITFTDGDTVTFNATIENNGTENTSRDFYVGFKIDESYIGDVLVNGLSSGTSTSVIQTWSASAGDHNITVVADRYDSVQESNETNNTLTLPLGGVEYPDLIVSNITCNPTTLCDGDSVTFNATIKNNGTGNTSRTFYNTFYIDESAIGGKWVNGLSAGSSINVTPTWIATPGIHTVKVMADSNNDIFESNETNNERSESLPGVEQADLIIGALTWTPSNLSDGQVVTFTVSVGNIGPGNTTRGFYTRFLIDNVSIGEESISGLDSGSSATSTQTWTATAGEHRIKAEVDAYNHVVESNETNNWLSKNLSYVPVEYLLFISSSSESYAEGDNATFSARASRLSSPTAYLGDNEVNLSLTILDEGNIIVFTSPMSYANKVFSGNVNLTGYSKGNYTARVTLKDNNNVTVENSIPFKVVENFSVSISTNKLIYDRDEIVHITGNAQYTDGSPVISAPVVLKIKLKGYTRTYSVITGSDGNFTYYYNPNYMEAGNFTAEANVVSDKLWRSAQTSFTMYGLYMTPSGIIDYWMSKNTSENLTFILRNYGESYLNSVTVNVVDEDLGDGVDAMLLQPPTPTLMPGAEQLFTLKLTAGNVDVLHANFSVSVTSAEGSSEEATLFVHLVEAVPIAIVNPTVIEAGMNPDDLLVRTVNITNNGYESMNNINISTPTLDWMFATSTDLGSISPGMEKSFDIIIHPTNDTAPGVYHETITISSSNHQPVSIYLTISVTSSQHGDLMFHVVNDVGEDITGASIVIQNQDVLTQVFQGTTNETGYYLFDDISTSRYNFIVQASGHASTSNSITVAPEVQTLVEPVLPKSILGVQLTVTPILIGDDYDIELDLTFETEVPPPILIPNPLYISYGVNFIDPEYETDGSITISNPGLISIFNVTVDSSFLAGVDITFSTGKTFFIGELKAKSSVTIPYHLTVTSVSCESKGHRDDIRIKGDYIYFEEYSDVTHNVYLSSEIPVFINMYNCPVDPGNLIDDIIEHFTFHYVLPGGSYSPGIPLPPPIPPVVDTVHERVKFSISQEATLERDAFAACLELTNKLTDKNIEGVKVDLNIKDENSSDAYDMFFVNLTFLNNINSIDGSGVINPSAVATADWLLVPKPGTGGTDSAGIDYTVQAFINYTVDGVSFTVNSTEAKINVMPQPLLNLTYRIPDEVKADTPFSITLNITNVGYGVARNLKLDSAQPVIYDNEAGLLVSFELIGSGIVGGSASDSILINFGDIAPGENKTAYWIMTASLDGEFTEFKASFSHNSALGGDETSLIKNITYIYVSDTTPPIVSSVSPGDNATGVKIDTTVTATFNEAMDSSTITTNSFSLAGSAVSGTLTYDSSTYTATFIPDAKLDYVHEYTATLSTDITDEAGNPLAEPYIWSFTTQSAPARLELSIPIYAPKMQKAPQGTELTYIIKVTNKGNEEDTIDLSVSKQSVSENPEEWWDVQFSSSSVILASEGSEDISLKVVIPKNQPGILNRITVRGESLDKSSTDVVIIAVDGEPDTVLFMVQFFFKTPEGGHYRELEVPDFAEIYRVGETQVYIAAFNPKNQGDLDNTYIKITELFDGNVIKSEIIPVKFEQHSEKVITTSFDMREDSYNFSNNVWPDEDRGACILGICICLGCGDCECKDGRCICEGGKCYGMAASSVFYFTGEELLPPGFATTYSLTTDTAQPRIDEYQNSKEYNSIRNWWYKGVEDNKMSNKEYETLKKNIGKGQPMIFFMTKKNGDGKVSHAVVAYRIVEDESKSYILIYDNNLDLASYVWAAFPYIIYDKNTGELCYEDYIKFKSTYAKPWWRRIKLFSPAELCVYDSPGRATGIVNGEVRNEIPSSLYDEENKTITILFPLDSYRYEVVGTDEGTYGLDIASIEDGEATTFTATDIPTTVGAIHQYTIDWDALSQGDKGVTVQIDSDGDGVFEQTITTDNTFQLPIASFTYSPENPVVDETITFNASDSYDPDGTITKYEWNFWDGNITNTTEEIINHSYSLAGDYTVNLTVTDDDGAMNSTSQWIHVALGVPPKITSFAPPSPVNDTVCNWRTFNVTVNQTVNVSWYLNATFQFTNVSVREANCTLHAAVAGEHNVTAKASNANGTDVQTWIWNVTGTPSGPNCTCGDICVNETGWWRDGGAFNTSGTPIQAAIDNATAGDVICVKDGTYTENVDVYKRLTIRSESGAASTSVRGASTYDYVFEVTADYVNISGFHVTGVTKATSGIYLYGANYCNISDNNANENFYHGIFLNYSSDNTLVNNTASDNSKCGISLSHSSDNMLVNNTASDNLKGISLSHSSDNTLVNNTANSNERHGIDLSSSSNNNLINNTMTGNGFNLGVSGSTLSHFIQNIDTSNTVDEKPIYYWVDQQNRAIPNDAGYVGVVNSTNITVRDLTLTKNGEGVLFAYTDDSIIENVIVSNNYMGGIHLYSSCNNNITSNTASDNRYYGYGIYLNYSSNNTLTDNTASDNIFGIYLDDSSYNTLSDNNGNLNGGFGICLWSSSYNTLTNNTANSNCILHVWPHPGFGIELYHSSYNELTDNIANWNCQNGIRLRSSSNHNTLTDNTASHNENDGVYLYVDSNNNNLINNTASDNKGNGFKLESNSNHNRIIGNNASDNDNNGICLYGTTGNPSSHNTVANNTADFNDKSGIMIEGADSDHNTIVNNRCKLNDYGISVRYGDYNNLTKNTCNQNTEYGIRLYQSAGNNEITNNTAISNNVYGIYISSSDYNIIYNNYFENTNNAQDDGTNVWNTTKEEGTNIIGGSYLGGNYWSDYAGKDETGDGLGDTILPYNSAGAIINGGDYLPLTEVLDVTPPATVSNLNEIANGTTWILWNWTNPSEPDFNHTKVWIDDEFMVNVTTPEHTYNATGLSPNTTYEIGTRTVDDSGNVNQTWMNDSAKTLLAHDITPPTITNVTATNITTNSVTITWVTDELSDSIVRYGTESGNHTVQKYNSTNVTTHTVNLSELLSNTTYYYLVNSTDARGNANESVEYNFTTAVISDTTPPGSVSNLGEIGKGNSWILWNWTNPPDPDFNHTEVWIDDEFNVTVTTPEHTYNATGLSANTTYEIGTRTVDLSGNVNQTWVNDTATTLIHDVNVSTDYAAATNGIKIKYNGTEIPASENLTIGDAYDIYYKIVNEGDYNESVNVSVLVANSTWTQTVATHTWNIKIGKYRYSGGDSWDTSALTPGGYNITVNASISIDDNWLNNERIRAVILALPSNQPPIADPNGPYNGMEGEVILFNGSESYDPDGSIDNYTWDFGDGNTGTGEKATHTYAQNGTYTVSLNVTDDAGATDVNSTTATIADTKPTANFYGTPTSGLEPLTVNFTDNSTSYDGITWAWDFGDGNTSTERNPNNTYAAGIYTVNLTVTDADGDSDTETKVEYINVTRVNQPPVADPNGPYNGTEGEEILFNGSGSYDSDGSIANYTWDFGDGNTGTGEKPTHTYAQNGTYTVSLNVTDNEGATDTNTTAATINDTEPTANFFATPTSGLESLTVDFTDTSTAYDTIVSWTWDFGDGNTSTEQYPNNIYAAGIYTVNLTVTDADGDSDTETKVEYINVTRENQPPISDPNGPYNGTEGEVIEFNGSGSYDPDGSIATYDWDFGDGSSGTGVSPTHTYTQNGTYTITLNVTDNDGATDTNSTTSTIADTKPTANFSGSPTSGPEQLTVNFADESTSYDRITTWNWDFGDGNTSTEQNTTHVYTADGTYTVSLTVYEADSDSDMETKVDYINVTRVIQPPVSDPNGPYNGTEGVVIQFVGTGSFDSDGTIIAYAWDFGDGNTSTDMNTTHAYAQDGTYTATLNVTDNEGATDTNTTTATIADTGPTANFSGSPTTGLKPLTVDFTDNSTSYDGITAWEWDFGDGNNSGEQNPTHEYTNAGLYSVTLTVYEADGNSDTEAKVDYIIVTDGNGGNQPPVADANGPYTGVEGAPITYNGSGSYDPDGSIASYAWDFGDGNTGTGVSPDHTYAQEGTYTVTLVVNDGVLDSAPDATTATVNDTEPTADFTAVPTSGSEPLTVEFTDLSSSYDGIASWSWDFGDGETSNEQNPTHTYMSSGAYTVALTVAEADDDTTTKEDYIAVIPAGDTISPVIESVSLDAYTTIPDAIIHVTVEATDNVGVTSVTADGVALVETGSTWEGDITAPSDTGDYTLTIRAEDAAENVAETTVVYSVVIPTGGLGVGISPRSTTASAGDAVTYNIIVSSTENFDDTIHVYVSMDGLPESYKLDMTAFEWVEQDVQIRAGEKKEIPLIVTIPAGETGRKVFRIKAESTCWTPNAYDSALITIT